MSLKLFVFAFVTSLLMLSPVHAENDEAVAGQAAAPGSAVEAAGSAVETPSPIEEKIRAYRERFDQRELQRQTKQAQRDEVLRKRHEAMQKYYNKQMDARLTMLEKQQEEIARRH